MLRPMAADDGVRASILAIWGRGRDRALGRVEVVEAAVAALAGGGPDEALRAGAQAEAHKLSGALGTFGMPEGSEHARALELAFEARAMAGRRDELAAHAAALRRIVEAGPSP
jgi:HPt (histidine-containing phosphotransfer) domain-containing protein